MNWDVMAKGLKRSTSRSSKETIPHSEYSQDHSPESRCFFVSSESSSTTTMPSAGLESVLPGDWRIRHAMIPQTTQTISKSTSNRHSIEREETANKHTTTYLLDNNHSLNTSMGSQICHPSCTRSSEKTESKIPHIFVSISALTLYAITSVGIVFINRHLFSTTFEHPLLLSWIAQTFGVIVFEVLFFLHFVSTFLFRKHSSLPLPSFLGFWFLSHTKSENVSSKSGNKKSTRNSLSSPSISSWFFRSKFFGLPRIQFSFSTAVRLTPLACSFVFMLVSTNYCLKFVPVSTYQVARSLTLMFNLVFSYFWIDGTISIHAIIAVTVTTIGFAIGAMDRAILTFDGAITGVLGSLFQALYTVQIRNSLPHVNNDQIALMFYNTLLASIILFPFVYFTNGFETLLTLPSIRTARGKEIWMAIIMSSVGSIAVNLLSYVAVKVTSPLSYSITGYAKAAIQSCGGILILREPYSFLSLSGILFTLLGSMYYSLAAINNWGVKVKCERHKMT